MFSHFQKQTVIIAGINVFLCSFHSIFTMSYLLDGDFYQPGNLMLIQGVIAMLCFWLGNQYFIGISLGALLFLHHVLELFGIASNQSIYILTLSSVILFCIHRLPWIEYIQSILSYKPDHVAGSCFSALLLLGSYDVVHDLSSTDLSLCLGTIGLIVLLHIRKSNLGPLLATFILIAFFAKNPSVPDFSAISVSAWQLPAFDMDILSLFRTSTYLCLLAFIDVATCLSVLERVMGFPIKPHLLLAQRTHALTSFVGSALGISLSATFYENMVNDAPEKEQPASLPYNALGYFLFFILLLFVDLNIRPFALCFCAYLAFMILQNLYERQNPLMILLPVLPLFLLGYAHMDYLLTLAITSITINGWGTLKGENTPENLKKILIFWAFLSLTVFSFYIF